MAGELEARLRAAYEALNARDVDGALEHVHPDVVAQSLVMEAEGAAYRGHEGTRRFVAELFEVFPDWRAEVESVEETGETALARVTVGGQAAGSGVATDLRAWLATRWKDGLVIEMRFFRTEEEARAAMVSPP